MNQNGHYPLWIHEMVETWRRRLIPNWTVKLMPNAYDAESEKVNAGEAQTDVPYRRIHIWVDISRRSPRAIEETIVHELLHAPFNSVDEAWGLAAENLANTERRHLYRAVKHTQEGAIENLARVLVALAHSEVPSYVSEGNRGHVGQQDD